ncbi:hypothetical protein [Rubrobacter calidifluminis]|nr:hypothetical protein [Rubrobacter calidifluminis]
MALTEYTVRHPLAARVLAAALGSRAIHPVKARRRLARSATLVAFRPQDR